VCFLDRADSRSRLFPTYGSDSRARDGAILGIRDGPDGTLNKWIQAWFRINAPTWIGDAECQMTTPTTVYARLGSTCGIGRISTYRNPFRRHDIPRENSHLRCSHERPSARSYWSTSPCRNSWEPSPHKQFPPPPAAAVRSNSIHSHKHTHTNTPSRSEAKTHHKPFQSKKKYRNVDCLRCSTSFVWKLRKSLRREQTPFKLVLTDNSPTNENEVTSWSLCIVRITKDSIKFSCSHPDLYTRGNQRVTNNNLQPFVQNTASP
jgi:hypothetical protein